MSSPVSIEIGSAALKRAGLLAVKMIRFRTAAGRDIDGNPFQPYSTNPFARPAGGIPQSARKRLKESLRYFRTAQGSLWMVVIGGYKAFKAARYPAAGSTVNLQGSGNMLRALTVLSVDASTRTFRIGWTRTEEAEKALYHNVTGVGKSRIKRKNLGLTATERKIIAKEIAVDIIIKT